MITTRRRFLIGSAAVGVAAALPVVLASRAPVRISVNKHDPGYCPLANGATDLEIWKDGERFDGFCQTVDERLGYAIVYRPIEKVRRGELETTIVTGHFEIRGGFVERVADL